MTNGLFGTFNYDDWLSSEPDQYANEEAYDEDGEYDIWKDSQI